jgi:hypothetical protein
VAGSLTAISQDKANDVKLAEPISKGQRVFTCGHSFHVWVPQIVTDLCKKAGIEGHVQVGLSSIGGSRTIQHWDIPDDKNTAKEALKTGKVDVLTLSPIFLPDSGIENFTTLALEHNPDIRVIVQPIWLRWDIYEPTTKRPEKVDHNAMTGEELRKRHAEHFQKMDDHIRELNQKYGKTVLSIAPAPQAVIALREKIIAGQAPGLKSQEDLFTDELGHGTPPLMALVGYCNYAVIYRRSPVGLPVPEILKQAKLGEQEAPLNRLLQDLAWEAVRAHRLSGVELAARERAKEIDAAIARLRDLGAFVREFHPRDNPQYWVQIVSTGVGETTRKTAEDFNDAAMNDVEIIGRGVKMHLHLRHTSITSAGLQRLTSVGTIERLELTGSNVDGALLKCLPKLPLQGLAVDSDVLTDDGLRPLAECRNLASISVNGRQLTNDSLEYLVRLPKLEGVSLGKNFTAQSFDILAPLKNLKEVEAAWQATPRLSDFTNFPNLRRLTVTGIDQDDETALTIADTFKSLEQAYLRETSITNAGVDHLSRLEMLKVLTLDGARIDDEVADSIRKMKRLQWLSVERCAVGDTTLVAISQCPNVWYLSFSETNVTDEGLAELGKLKKLHVLYLTSCKSVTDDSVEVLSRMSDAEGLLLNLQDSGITEKGARQLQHALPRAQIVWGIPPVTLR